jgi:hypothetical protein
VFCDRLAPVSAVKIAVLARAAELGNFGSDVARGTLEKMRPLQSGLEEAFGGRLRD